MRFRRDPAAGRRKLPRVPGNPRKPTDFTGLQLLGVQTFVQPLFYGGALVLAVALPQAGAQARRCFAS